MPKDLEVFFYGQIEGCSNRIEGENGIFVEAFLEYGKNGIQSLK